MRLRSAARDEPTPWSWAIFPAEIRFMILGAISTQKNPGWASHAAVCKEWNDFLEPHIFRKLNLRVHSLEDFPLVVPCDSDKRLLVRHICLNIELPRYKPRCCFRKPGKSAKIGEIVYSAVFTLFTILSTWKREKDLVLELNVYSLSDCEHWFKNIYLSSDNTEDNVTCTSFSGVSKNGTVYHDPQHGWDQGRRSRFASEGAVRQLFQEVDLIGVQREARTRTRLPYITAVTGCLVRRQMRRNISPCTLLDLLGALRGLEAIWYEPWKSYTLDWIDQNRHDESMYTKTFQPPCWRHVVVESGD